MWSPLCDGRYGANGSAMTSIKLLKETSAVIKAVISHWRCWGVELRSSRGSQRWTPVARRWWPGWNDVDEVGSVVQCVSRRRGSIAFHRPRRRGGAGRRRSVARGHGVRARASLHVHGAPDWMPRALGEWLRPRKRRLPRRLASSVTMKTASVSENGGAFSCRRYSHSLRGCWWCYYGARARSSAATRSRSWRPTTPSRRSKRRRARTNRSSRGRSWPKRKTGPANLYPVRPPPDEYW